VVAQWVNIYDLRPEHFRTVVRTFANVFPHVTLWELQRGSDYLLLGSEDEQRLDLARFASRLSEPLVVADLRRVDVHDRAALAARFIAADGALRAFAGEGPENTDDNGHLEYAAPRVLHKRMSDENIAAIDPIIQPIETIATGDPDEIARLSAEVEKRRRARADLNEADRLLSANRVDEALVLQERAFAALPEETAIRETITIVAIKSAQQRLSKGDNAGALADAERVERVDPDNVDAQNIRAHAYLATGRLAEAIPVLERVRRLRPESFEAVLNLSTVYMNSDRTREARAAIEEFERAGHKLDADLRYNLGCVLLKDGDALGAIRQFDESLRLRPDPNVRKALDAARRTIPDAPPDDGAGGGI
jgi:tetratricopeptide (TPR) repeat protein